MKVIAAADKNWGIGNKGKLLVSIPGDMKFFRSTTMGKTVVMGRKTLESLPGGRPLKDRDNIVLTRNAGYKCDGVKVVHSVDELKEALEETDTDDVFVIGGGAIYKELLPLCDEAYITRLDYSYEADTYFPDLDADPEWELADEGEEETYYDLIYNFCIYRRK
ncbi:MAG: dihydrofolate reductase [Lachnospiraceae bacterium]|nr:dihydrofolate reductase [Lachnospiraceae bacterium]